MRVGSNDLARSSENLAVFDAHLHVESGNTAQENALETLLQLSMQPHLVLRHHLCSCNLARAMVRFLADRCCGVEFLVRLSTTPQITLQRRNADRPVPAWHRRAHWLPSALPPAPAPCCSASPAGAIGRRNESMQHQCRAAACFPKHHAGVYSNEHTNLGVALNALPVQPENERLALQPQQLLVRVCLCLVLALDAQPPVVR